jgi:hypothetical protein
LIEQSDSCVSVSIKAKHSERNAFIVYEGKTLCADLLRWNNLGLCQNRFGAT